MTAIGRRNMVVRRPEDSSASVALRGDKVGSNVRISAKSKALTTASSRFIPGPAAATSAMSRRGWCIFRGSIGTGLAQPNRKLPGNIKQISGKIMVPNGSIWAIGFRVNLPAFSAVWSPKIKATYQCITSWTMTEKIKIIIESAISSGMVEF